ncbi:hypothetical protein [Kandleria vitulina]|uniref:hypothetical protein n=2 Tax=Kandleria vitulina TaxID=1630 RepID=UPI0004E213D3|nr:hypothetical protein [Kandleria vitulina]
MKMKKLTTFALAAAFTIGTFGISVPVKAAENSTDYTITIPATLTVEQKGWNATDGIKAQVKSGDIFDSGKKLTVTAKSTNSWALKSGANTIGYNLATTTGTYSSSATPASWEFSATDLNADGGKTNPMGIIVEDYSSKPAGEYKDTVTFTAKVENNLVSFTIKRDVSYSSSGNYTVAPGTTWRQFIESGNAPASVTIYGSNVWHDLNTTVRDCGGTFICNTADNRYVRPDEAIIDGATYACEDYVGYKGHD